MALHCDHCGAQNPDDMRFCQQCGAPLAAAAETPPPAAPQVPPAPAPAPAPAAVVYRAAPTHRLPLGSIIGLMIGVLGVLAAIGILSSHRGAAPVPVLPATATPVHAVPRSTATRAPGGLPAGAPTVTAVPALPTAVQPSPTQAVQPTVAPPATLVPVQPTQAALPTLAPQPAPTAAEPQPAGPTGTGQGQTLTTTTFSLVVPPGWQIGNQSTQPSQNEVVLQDSATAPNALDIYAGLSSTQTTAQTVLQAALSSLQQHYADAQACGNTVQASIGGVSGTVLPVCFTLTPQGGAALSVADLIWAAVDPSGTAVYLVSQTAEQTNQAFFTDAGTVTGSIQWLGGGQ